MNKSGAFRLPDADRSLHLYKVTGAVGSRRGIDRGGRAWDEFEVDAYADEDEEYVCDSCKKRAAAGWVTAGGAVSCSACTTPHANAYEPCVLFHKFSRRCWSEEEADRGAATAWVEAREKATVYADRAAAEASRGDFLGVVQKAVVIIPVAAFDQEAAKHAENF